MKGKVYLVGAGPGDTDLMTVKGRKMIESCDVLVYDRLANPYFLTLTKEECEKIYVGKESNNHAMPQEDIQNLLVSLAKAGKMVVRLKGGDPYVFGRGGEEGQLLNRHQIPFEVVPGITSAIGGLAYAGIPITHRDLSTSFHVITGHLRDEEETQDWETMAKLKGTLVILMGMKNLKKITTALMAFGKDKSTPVGIVNWASHGHQKVVTGTLETIVALVASHKIAAPSLIVIGDVVALREELNFFERKPLFGKRILVTRASTQTSKLADALKNLGASVMSKPMINIKALEVADDSLSNLSTYQYLIFTSTNGVHRFFELLQSHRMDSRALYHNRLVCIGEPTAKALLNHGVKADLIPDRHVAEGLVDLLQPILTENDRVLIPRSKNGRSLLIDELRKICTVDELHVYETKATEETVDGKYDYVTFTSASTVSNFFYKNTLMGKAVSIGPITSEALRQRIEDTFIESDHSTIESLIDAIVKDVARAE